MQKNLSSWNCFELFSLILIIAAAGAVVCTVFALIGFFIIGVLIMPMIIIAVIFVIAGMIVQALFIKTILRLLCGPWYCCCCPGPVYSEKPEQSADCYKEQPPAGNYGYPEQPDDNYDCREQSSDNYFYKNEQPVQYTQGE